ncbi:MAG TPA: DUF2155 domain-containing protein [Candidatus Pelagibacter sp.]|jgi:hypothetical protein|nr:DUF2155 domain-containing protein [Candidatus Pelagibacter sp.]
MRFGKLKIYIFVFIFFLENTITLFAVDKIESIPLINLEELSPTFEEDKDVLEKKDEQNSSIENDENFNKEKITINTDKIYINITALDKITAKTLSIKLGIGEKKYFGSLEIIGLKCQLSENNEFNDAVAYLQVKDLAAKDNNQVFLFNGWTFASSPTLQSIDHPIYDLWITGCENI